MPAACADKLRDALHRIPHVRLAILFGSAAAGTLRAGSDLDVGILLDHGADASPVLAVTLSRATGLPVDLVWLDEAPPLLRFEIARSGLVLVERAPHAWSDFRARAMIDWWDWAPTARLVHRTTAARLKQEAARGAS